ncbi:putative dsRNA-binding protein [Adhaeribacter rhizoryzae]|uniref:putative dsRNA-binding protein n=1 Tax=Adhaeribacter rhizoryzae TaxID=2607907 RepID=UPI003742DD4B
MPINAGIYQDGTPTYIQIFVNGAVNRFFTSGLEISGKNWRSGKGKNKQQAEKFKKWFHGI